MTGTTLERRDALVSVVTRGALDSSTVTNHDDEVTARRAASVPVDLARSEPPDAAGTAVDLAQAEHIPCDAARSGAAGRYSPARPGGTRQLLSPSWPSAIRMTNVFGTADLIDTRHGPRP